MVAKPNKPEIDLPAPDKVDDPIEREAVLILACAAIRREWQDGERRKRRLAAPAEWSVPGLGGTRLAWNGHTMPRGAGRDGRGEG
jgi:hypothetical protein